MSHSRKEALRAMTVQPMKTLCDVHLLLVVGSSPESRPFEVTKRDQIPGTRPRLVCRMASTSITSLRTR